MWGSSNAHFVGNCWYIEPLYRIWSHNILTDFIIFGSHTKHVNLWCTPSPFLPLTLAHRGLDMGRLRPGQWTRSSLYSGANFDAIWMFDHYILWASTRPKQKIDFKIIIWATLSLSTLHLLWKALESALIPHGDLPNDLLPKAGVLIALWSCKNIFLVAGCCFCKKILSTSSSSCFCCCCFCKKIPSTSSSSLPLLSPLCPGVDVIGTQSGEDLSFLISLCCFQWYLR